MNGMKITGKIQIMYALNLCCLVNFFCELGLKLLGVPEVEYLLSIPTGSSGAIF